jgi:integral membrane sensor domain MASE1
MTNVSIEAARVRARLLLSHLQGPLLVALAYYLGAEAAFLIGTLSDNIFAPFWPPNAILFCALALVPYRQWPLYILAALPAHVVAELSVGMGWTQIWVAFATNTMVATLNAFGVRYLLGGPPWFDSLHKVVAYILITAVCGSAVSALGGAFVRITGEGDFGRYWLFWAQWYVANALACLTLVPMLLTWLAKNSNWEVFGPHARRAEAAVLLAGLAGACVIAFNATFFAKPSYVPAFLYMPLPFVIWAAARFRTMGASASILLVTVVSISSALHGRTVFASEDVEASVLSLQLFLMVVSGSILLLGASVEELRRAEQVTAELARCVLGAQDQERRHVATRLLDDIAQRLAVATWGTSEQPARAGLEETVEQSVHDLRKLSYLLHPPMLEEAGLEVALRARLDQYARSTGTTASLEASQLGRLPAELELTIFRVVEEALANVKLHSGSTASRISIEHGSQSSSDGVVLVVETGGSGMPSMAGFGALIKRLTVTTTGWGLGLARMRERVQRIGGSLEVSSTNNKTIVRATFPVPWV